MRRGILRALVAAFLWCMALAAGGADAPETESAQFPTLLARGADPVPLHPYSRSWIDETGVRRIDEVEASAASLPWKRRKMEQADRIEGRALWIEFEVMVGEPDQWFVEVGGAGIDRVELYYRNAAGAWVTQKSGDDQPISSWPVPGRYPTFALAQGMGRPVRYWMRVEHSRLDFAAPLTVYRERTLLAKRDREQFLLGAYFGLAALLAIASVVSGLVYRDRAFLAFAAYITLVGCSQLARAGLGAEHVWPDWPYWNDLAVLAWPGLPVAAALWFIRMVTEPARLSHALDAAVIGLVAAVLLGVAADAILQARNTMVLVLALSGLSLAAVVAMVVWGWVDGRDPDLRWIAYGFLPVVVLALFPLARGFNLIPVSVMTRFAVFFGTALQMPILYYALQRRSARRRESQLRAAALSHTDALTGLPHRGTFLERLETALARARNSKQPLALMGVRIANLQAIAEEFGRDAVEKALVVAASQLRRCITDIEMVARVGENEFALLMEGPLDGPTVTSRAQQVVASGLRQTEALPAALTLKFHVTAALLPHGELDGVATLQWVLDALDQFAADARKLIKPLNF
ncbi:diguanylate cyclase [Ramlibacter sp. XY19]|uniref:sensor domain-containing diguanylate cyclase n=1 Tax=Ramlibacter paludis TaxID=2908000 RepID=UPI0023DA16C3|nr:7TM diverse intracellular signaling domain-containing protein [Ramlibacter paludis]MCG2591754.1 diguanylate cyclase [Ramlibacter paludis]